MEGHKIACSYTVKETYTDAPNIPIYSSDNQWKIQHACSLELVVHFNMFWIFLVLKSFSSNGEETNSSSYLKTWVSISTSLYLKARSTLAGIMSSWFWEKSMCHCHARNFRSVREKPVWIRSVYNASSSWWNYKEHNHFFAKELYLYSMAAEKNPLISKQSLHQPSRRFWPISSIPHISSR